MSQTTTTNGCSTTAPRITRTVTESRHLRRGTEGALACGGGDRRQAFRAVLGRRRLVRGGLVTLHQVGDRHDDEEVDDRRDDQEREQRVNKKAVSKVRAVDVEEELAEVGLPSDRRDQRRDEARRERRHECAERGPDEPRDGEIDDVAAQQELAETAHATSSARRV